MIPKTPASPPLASGIPVHCSHLRIADVTSLIQNPRNPNKHGDAQVALLAKIIRHQGWRAPITISRRSGFIVTGHGRLEAAKLLGVQSVPVDEQDFATEADEWAHLIADNRIAELADPSRAELATLLAELDTGDFDMDLTGFDYSALEELMTAAAPEGDSDESRATLAERFGVPPFSVLDARQGYWQDRKRAWLALGIKSEIGRGGGYDGSDSQLQESGQARRDTSSPGGSPRPACDYSNRQRGDGSGKAMT